MPGFDRTGPQGEGPKTGRGLGRCGNARRPQNQPVDGEDQVNGGRGFGAGRRIGRGGRRGGGFGRRGSGTRSS